MFQSKIASAAIFRAIHDSTVQRKGYQRNAYYLLSTLFYVVDSWPKLAIVATINSQL